MNSKAQLGSILASQHSFFTKDNSLSPVDYIEKEDCELSSNSGNASADFQKPKNTIDNLFDEF